MSKYEVIFILDARSSESARNEAIKDVQDLVAKLEGKVVNCSVWLDKHRMAFP